VHKNLESCPTRGLLGGARPQPAARPRRGPPQSHATRVSFRYLLTSLSRLLFNLVSSGLWLTPPEHPLQTTRGPRLVRAPNRLLPAPSQRLAHGAHRSEEHTSELQSRENLVCRLLLEKKK